MPCKPELAQLPSLTGTGVAPLLCLAGPCAAARICMERMLHRLLGSHLCWPLCCALQALRAGQLAQQAADDYMVPLNLILNCSAGRFLAVFHCNTRLEYAHPRGLCGLISTASLHCRPLCCWPGTA